MKAIQLIYLSGICTGVIDAAEADGVVLDEGNIIDLLADNITNAPIEELRQALAASKYGYRFPSATQPRGE